MKISSLATITILLPLVVASCKQEISSQVKGEVDDVAYKPASVFDCENVRDHEEKSKPYDEKFTEWRKSQSESDENEESPTPDESVKIEGELITFEEFDEGVNIPIADGAPAVFCPPVLDDTEGLNYIKPDGFGENIIAEDIELGLSLLASEEFNGRRSAQPESYRKATQYVIDELKAAGVEPGNNGSYLQDFSWVGYESSAEGFFKVTHPTSNVIGFIAGSDPVLKNEFLVLGAHLDHLGQDERGNIYYGADDNASGSMAILNIAKSIQRFQVKMKRSLVVIFFAAEEEGNKGSRHYVANPVVPLADTVAMLNLDMVGHSHGELQALGSRSFPKGVPTLDEIADGYLGTNMAHSNGFPPNSDHSTFAMKGLPTIVFHTGEHQHYHQTTDTVEKLDIEGLAVVSKIVGEFTIALLQDESVTLPNIVDQPPYLLRQPSESATGFTDVDLHGHAIDPFKE